MIRVRLRQCRIFGIDAAFFVDLLHPHPIARYKTRAAVLKADGAFLLVFSKSSAPVQVRFIKS
jgi:hypothetical protein